jgi:hypothetical protein
MRKTVIVMAILIFGILSDVCPEVVTPEVARNIALNWIESCSRSFESKWSQNGDFEISGQNCLMLDEDTLAWVFQINPSGFIIVAFHTEITPVIAYSSSNHLDLNAQWGYARILRADLEKRVKHLKGILAGTGPPASQSDIEAINENHSRWELWSKDPSAFKQKITSILSKGVEGVNSLLESRWRQDSPFNRNCPLGNAGQRCAVGCVATATAQIMYYWQWPLSGVGSKTYYWYGDGSASGRNLSATFSDTYDWANMYPGYIYPYPDSLLNTDQARAVAELSYEVGVAYEMDYHVSGSSASISSAQLILPQYFRYHDSISIESRNDYTAETWFSMIQSEINLSRPLLYTVYETGWGGHAMVCDGWRIIAGITQISVNYGWGGNSTWYIVDNLTYGSEYWYDHVGKGIHPNGDAGYTIISEDYPDYAGAIQISPDLSRYPNGSSVSLAAVAEEGWEFESWSGDLSGTDNPMMITVNENVSVKANYATTGMIEFIGEYQTPGHAYAIYIMGDYLFAVDNNGAGLMIYDISIPNEPVFIANDTVPYGSGLAASGDYVYISCQIDTTLRIIDISDIYNPETVVSHRLSGACYDIEIIGDYAYLACWDGGLQIYDISIKTSPDSVGGISSLSGVSNLFISDDYAYVADYYDGLYILDITDTANPAILGNYDLGLYVGRICQVGSYVYLGTASYGIRIIDVSDPTNPDSVGYYHTPLSASAMAYAGGYLYLCSGNFIILDVRNPLIPLELCMYPPWIGSIYALSVAKEYAYLNLFGDLTVLRIPTGPENTAPEITSPNSAIAIEDVLFSYVATAIDPDGTAPSISYESYPDWMSTSGDTILGIPLEGTPDTSFVITATDGLLSDTLAVTVTVTPVNDPPLAFSRLLPEDSTSLAERSVQFVWEQSIDPEGKNITYALGLLVHNVDTSIILNDTNLTMNFETFLLPAGSWPVTWSVAASDSVNTTTATNGEGYFTLDIALSVDEPNIGYLPEYALFQNYPNPFNPITDISFSLPEANRVRLEVYNLLGQLVSKIHEGKLKAGIHSFTWDGSNVASGVYLYRLTAGEFVESKKMILLK